MNMESDQEFLLAGGVLISGPLGEFRMPRENFRRMGSREREGSLLITTSPDEALLERVKEWCRERWEEKPYSGTPGTENGWFTIRIANQTRYLRVLRFVSHQCWWDTKDRSSFDSGR